MRLFSTVIVNAELNLMCRTICKNKQLLCNALLEARFSWYQAVLRLSFHFIIIHAIITWHHRGFS